MADKNYEKQDFSHTKNVNDGQDRQTMDDTSERDDIPSKPQHNNGINTSDDEDVGSDGDENVADRASQNEAASIQEPSDDSDGFDYSDDEASAHEGTSEADVNHPNPSNDGTFDDDMVKKTTADPNYQDKDSEDLDALFAPIDSDLKTIKDQLSQHRNALASLDTSRPEDAVEKMRNILIQDNDTERKMYKLINNLEYNTVDYAEIKDKVLKYGDKKRLSTLLDELQPLFKVSSKKQMNTFIKAFNRIISIERNGSLSNLIQLAQYYDRYKDDQSDDKGRTNSSKPGKGANNDGTNNE